MNKLDKSLLLLAWAAGGLVAAVLVALPFFTYAALGFSGPFLLSSILLLFVLLAVGLGS